MEVDMVVLLVGMIPGQGTENIFQIAHLQSNSHGFIESGDWQLHKNMTSQPGVFVAGACNGPMSIDETIEHARSAAIEIHEYLQNS
jgi:heterodisulfide reductase subunit A